MAARPRPTPVLLCILAGFLAPLLVLCATPPFSRDALIHHLAIPALWLRNGGIYEIPWAHHSYFPMNVDLLYAACLALGNDILPKFIHFAFALATGGLIYTYLKPRHGRPTALLGFLFFLTIPAVMRVSTQAYVDCGLTFFTTASVFALLRYRETPEKWGWLVASALSMGLALGTKYNALVPWAFLNLAVVFFVARDTGKSGRALLAGAAFCAVVLATASPWLVRNALWTQNPVFPLFDSVFAGFRDAPHPATAYGHAMPGFFARRELLYGEPWWMTLLIPLRMFFSGQDDSDRFFDGVLCPGLLLLAPFAFLDRRHRGEHLLFAAYSGFFLLVALFMGAARIRYILPVLPFFSVLCAVAVKNLWDAAKTPAMPVGRLPALLAAVAVAYMLLFSAGYLYRYYRQTSPTAFVLGRESRDAFLVRHAAEYPAVSYLNARTPADSRVLFLFVRGRAYYLERDYLYEPTFGMATADRMMTGIEQEGSLLPYLRERGVTHVLLRGDLLSSYLENNYGEEGLARFLEHLRTELVPLYQANGYMVYGVPQAGEGARGGGRRGAE